MSTRNACSAAQHALTAIIKSSHKSFRSYQASPCRAAGLGNVHRFIYLVESEASTLLMSLYLTRWPDKTHTSVLEDQGLAVCPDD
ncbi:hypothetical protein PoB_003637600 [Plakobranchus ocellatus]|uniref:Uncharacterized protein n=1 Tax=Plakobranchus ocellatus TaxID=259542 RepID=A0AAV4ATI7_9GAST|nr:hypothetical protein PoB_003637600 [Plakobranchus ocellatus]